jgi:hypothetical protein
MGRRPLSGLANYWFLSPGVHFVHPGLYASVRFADWRNRSLPMIYTG